MGPNDGSEKPAGSPAVGEMEGAPASDSGIAAPMSHPEVRNRGQIAEMTLPEGWVEAPPVVFSGGQGMKSRRVIHPPDLPAVRLTFFYRGLPMNRRAGQAFLKVLQQPPHDISDEEWNSLTVLLRDRDPEEFTRFTARTEDWNGRRVLVVEGRYLELQEDNLEIFVDAVGDGRTVQEILYQAPKDLYNRYLRGAETALKSIKWKSSSSERQTAETVAPEADLPSVAMSGTEFDGGVDRATIQKIYEKLSDDEKIETRRISSTDDLGAAWKDNGERTLHVAARVNVSHAGILGAANDDVRWCMHAVSITHIEFGPDGDPLEVYYENTAGGAEHGYPWGTPVPASEFVSSMQGKSGYAGWSAVMEAIIRTERSA